MRSLPLASADLKDRLRHPYVVLALVVMVVLTGYYLPDRQASYVTLKVMNTRGVYNSAWVGMVVAVLGSVVFTLPAFYLVKNALERDHRLGLWQLVLTSPTGRFTYLLSKAFSNFALLCFLTLTVALTALPIQLFRAEVGHVEPLQLFLPTLLVTLPSMFLIGCLAVCFEAIPFLRTGAGNVVYFFLWTALVIPGLAVSAGVPDPLGGAAILRDVLYSVSSQPSLQDINIGVSQNAGLHSFVWSGFDWNLGYVLGRAGWMLSGLLLLGCASILYQAPRKTLHKAPLSPRTSHLQFRAGPAWLTLVHMELRIALKGMPLLASGVLAVLWVLGFVFPAQMLPLLLVAPVLLLSRLGSQAYQHHLPGVLFTTLQGENMLHFKGLAAFLISMSLCSSVLLTLLMRGQGMEALGVFSAALFTSTLAVALGAISQNHTLFEALYFAVWYLGAFNHWSVLDFTRPAAWLVVFPLSLFLFILAHTLQTTRLRAGLLH